MSSRKRLVMPSGEEEEVRVPYALCVYSIHCQLTKFHIIPHFGCPKVSHFFKKANKLTLISAIFYSYSPRCNLRALGTTIHRNLLFCTFVFPHPVWPSVLATVFEIIKQMNSVHTNHHTHTRAQTRPLMNPGAPDHDNL